MIEKKREPERVRVIFCDKIVLIANLFYKFSLIKIRGSVCSHPWRKKCGDGSRGTAHYWHTKNNNDSSEQLGTVANSQRLCCWLLVSAVFIPSLIHLIMLLYIRRVHLLLSFFTTSLLHIQVQLMFSFLFSALLSFTSRNEHHKQFARLKTQAKRQRRRN